VKKQRSILRIEGSAEGLINNRQYALPHILGRQQDIPQNTGSRYQMYHISHVRQAKILAYIMPGWNLRVCSKCSNHL